MNKKGVSGVTVGLVVLSIAILVSVGALTGIIPTTFGEGEGTTVIIQQPEGQTNQNVVVPTPPTTGGGLPIETLKAQAKDSFTMNAVGAYDYYLEFYAPGTDVANPNVNYLDAINVSGGSGQTTAYVIQTGSPYDVYFDGIGTYYDMKLDNWNINYNPDRGVGFLLVAGDSYVPVSSVGAFVDVDTLPEAQTGWNQTDTDIIQYDESAMGGSGWIKMDLGNANSNSIVENPVLCFRDSDGDMENNEITAITAAYVSGSTKIQVPADLLIYWQDAMGGGGAQCVQIADSVGSSEKARWEITFTVDESNWAAGEEFEITLDDMGDYLQKQYPSRNAKATAETLTVGNQA